MANIAFLLNDLIAAVQPDPFYRHAADLGWETSHWAGKANSFHWLEGLEPSYGYVLFRWKDISTITDANPEGTCELTIKTRTSLGGPDQDREITFGNLYIKSIKALYSNSTTTKDDTVCLVHLVDKRHVFAMTHIAQSYNVPSIAGITDDFEEPEYYDAESLDFETDIWTWESMFEDLWLKLPGSISGGVPDFPNDDVPSGYPRDFQFWGISVWEAIGIFLERLQYGIGLNHEDNTFYLFQKGVAQDGLAEKLAELGSTIGIATCNPITPANARFPATIKVMFPKVTLHYGTAIEVARIENKRQECYHVISKNTSITGAIADTAMTIIDDLEALVNFDGTLFNSSALDGRATSIAADFKNRLYQSKDDRRAFVGLVLDLLPGSEVHSVNFTDLATHSGLITQIEQTIDTTRGKEHGILTTHKVSISGSLSSRKNFGPAGGIGFPNLMDASRFTYPHHTHLVRIDDGTSETGDPVTPVNGYFPGKVMRCNPATSPVSGTPFENGDDCWILVANLYVGSKNTAARLYQDEVYVAKLNGWKNNPAGEEDEPSRPLFVVRRAENMIYPVSLSPGVSAGASQTVTLPDGRSVSATNATSQTLPAGAATAYNNQYNAAWYLTGSAAPSESDPGSGGDWYYAPVPEGGIKATDGTLSVPLGASHWMTGAATGAITLTNLHGWEGNYGDPMLIMKADQAPTGWLLVEILPRWQRLFIGQLSALLLSDDPVASVDGLVALDGGSYTGPTSVSADNFLSLAGANNRNVLLVSDRSDLDEEDNATFILANVEHERISLVTDVRFVGEGGKIQIKSRPFSVMPDGDETEWTDVGDIDDAFTDATFISDVDYTSPNFTYKTKTAKVRSIGSESSPTTWASTAGVEITTSVYQDTGEGNCIVYAHKSCRVMEAGSEDTDPVVCFTLLDVVTYIRVNGTTGALEYDYVPAYLVDPGATSTETVFTPIEIDIVADVTDEGTHLEKVVRAIGVWHADAGTPTPIVDIEECE